MNDTKIYIIHNLKRRIDSDALTSGNVKKLLHKVAADNQITIKVGVVEKEAPIESHLEYYSTPYWVLNSEEDANLILLLTDNHFTRVEPIWEITGFKNVR